MEKKVNPVSRLKGSIELPADKSISHRAALFAALHEGQSRVQNFSTAADPHSTVYCLRQLGVNIQERGNELTIEGVGRNGFSESDKPLDCGNSGTTMRLLSGIVGGAGVGCTLTGDESLRARTMKRIIEPLREMGIDIEARADDFAPLHIRRDEPIKPVAFALPIPSAQLKSCILLAGLFGKETSEVVETVTSRDHTERLLQLSVNQTIGRKIIKSDRNCPIPEQTYAVPGDFSAAAFWLVAGSIHPRAEISLPSTGLNPTRTGALNILQAMGTNIVIDNEREQGYEPVGDLQVCSAALEPVHITAEMVPNCIDEIPVLLVAMCFADGISRVEGASELHHKETDRLKAMEQILNNAGAKYDAFEDGFKIYGDPHFCPQNAAFNSYNDHRIAMAAAVLALMAESESTIKNAECTDISYPSFWDDLRVLTN